MTLQVTRLATVSFLMARGLVEVTAINFHRQFYIRKGDVNVVAVNRVFRNRIQTGRLQGVDNLLRWWAGKTLPFTLSGLGRLASARVGVSLGKGAAIHILALLKVALSGRNQVYRLNPKMGHAPHERARVNAQLRTQLPVGGPFVNIAAAQVIAQRLTCFFQKLPIHLPTHLQGVLIGPFQTQAGTAVQYGTARPAGQESGHFIGRHGQVILLDYIIFCRGPVLARHGYYYTTVRDLWK